MSWNLSLIKRETENGYTSTAFSDDIPGTVGPFNFELARPDIINKFNEIIPFIVQSSIRFRSVLALSEKPEDTLDKVVDIGRYIFSSLNPKIRDIINSCETLHIFTDDLELPWTLLHNGTDFVSLKHPMGINSSKKRLHTDKSEVSGKLRILFVVDSKDDLPQARFEITRILNLLSTKSNVEYLLLQGKDANYSNVRSVLQNDYFHIIHMATHVVTNTQTNDQSGVVLNDDILTPEDIYHTIKTDPSWLVYMNACESSVNTDKNKQNGLTDLATSFLNAGCNTYIGTPNIVNDFSASEIAIYFYTHLLNDISIGRSLMMARSEFLNNYSYDLSWITFLLYGNPNSKLKFSTERNIEEEIRRYINNKRSVSISQLANDLRIDISLANKLLRSISKRKSISDLVATRRQGITTSSYDVGIGDIHLEKLIEMGESATLEFKSSMSNPIEPLKELSQLEEELKGYENKLREIEIKDEREAMKMNITKLEKNIQSMKADHRNAIEIEILKTISAFLNSSGGTLLVGVKNDGSVSGIETDYDLFSDADGWIQHLKSLIKSHIGIEIMMYINVKIIQHHGKTVAVVQVKKNQKPVFTEYNLKGQKRVDLFIRALNTTEILNPKNYLEYFKQNWKI